MTHIFDKAISQMANFSLFNWLIFIIIVAWLINWIYVSFKD
jgi:hypothetical protein